jgi:tetratricopeptide (TPR) repeat protein
MKSGDHTVLQQSAKGYDKPLKAIEKYREVFVVLGLALLTFCAFNTILENDYITFDDPLYVTQNSAVKQGLTLPSIRWAFSTFKTANWYPLTWLSHMLDVQLYGLDAGGHHLTSLLIHLCNGVLIYGWLRYTTGAVWRSALAAVLFAVHPLRTESVAWVAERKDVLSCFFGLLTLWAYVFYVNKPNFSRYIWVFVFLTLGLMSKAMLVTWPILLLLLDVWPLKRWKGTIEGVQSQAVSWITLLKEKVPLGGLAVIFSIVAFLSQKDQKAIVSLQDISFPLRLANVFTSYVQYLGKVFYPVYLAVYYPYQSIWLIYALCYFAFFGMICLIVIRYFHRRPYLLIGWLWFIIGLLPVIGLVQIGNQALADRYTYIPSIGLSIAIAWFIGDMSQRGKVWRRSAITLCILCLASLLCLTWRQTYYWKDSQTLYDRTLKITQNNWIIEGIYAEYLKKIGHLDLAEQRALRVMDIIDDRPEIWFFLGTIYLEKNQLDKAELYLKKSFQLNCAYPQSVCFSLGQVYARQKKYDEARQYFNRAMELHFDSIAVFYALADVYLNQGKLGQAFDMWREVLTVDSTQTEAMVSLAWNMTTRADPNAEDASIALQYALQAAELTRYNSATVLDVLAVAYARHGDFEKAIQYADQAIQKAESKKLFEFAADIKKRKQCYEDKKPWIEESQSKGEL